MNDDLIKRSDAAEVVYKALKTPPPKGVLTDTMQLAIALVRDIPSADRPQGEWIIEIDVNGNTYGRCSICGMRQYTGQLNFCSDCGARMKGVEDE